MLHVDGGFGNMVVIGIKMQYSVLMFCFPGFEDYI